MAGPSENRRRRRALRAGARLFPPTHARLYALLRRASIRYERERGSLESRFARPDLCVLFCDTPPHVESRWRCRNDIGFSGFRGGWLLDSRYGRLAVCREVDVLPRYGVVDITLLVKFRSDKCVLLPWGYFRQILLSISMPCVFFNKVVETAGNCCFN